MLVAIAIGAALAAGAAPAVPPRVARYEIRAQIDPAEHRIAIEGTLVDADGANRPFRETKTINHPIVQEGEDYARGFAETEGTIREEGVFLSGSSGWYPAPEKGSLVTFSLDVTLPAGWEAISQGRRTVLETTPAGRHVVFVCDDPQEKIWLVAGPWIETARNVEGVDVVALLRTRDDALASKYLEATGPYLAMYGKLLGPYPYPKFALVENFWETGYGMPSFTLLGSKVIRLPFILTSSYPHEILHDWWGNGVYVATEGGNWSEGLTAYLADHLFAEQAGTGAAYRQDALQKYADYAARSRDFPLSQFRERHSPATEAVGYGKALMLFHMMRRELGDRVFVLGLRELYARSKFRRASFDDVRRALESAAARDLSASFDPWVTRAGAPRLRIEGVQGRADAGGVWHVTGTIVQAQRDAPFPLRVPVAVTVEGHADAVTSIVRSSSAKTPFELTLPARPLRVDVDPEFDLFRTLDVEEAPPALSGAFGAERCTMILPSHAPPDLLAAYRAMAQEWNTGRSSPMTITDDEAIAALPDGGSIWIVGFENRLRSAVDAAMKRYGDASAPDAGRARVLVARREPGKAPVIAFVAADRAAQVPGLTRKLPHYHKYSYLAFEGDEPTNVKKGRWPVSRSPMTAWLEGTPEMATLPAREPLAELPPAFSKERMLATVRALADPSLAGRPWDGAGARKAAATIAAAMKEAGLEVLAIDDAMPNVVGVLRGTKPEWASQSVVVGAHYDHLGTDASGTIFPGADDNASGVAILLELARQMAASGAASRTIVFAAFTGEEKGRLGSKRYAAGAGAWPAPQAIGMVNLDSVGRLGGGKVLVLGSSTADEWAPIAQGAGYVTGAAVEAVAADLGGSDQTSFVEAGVPAVQIFTGAHPDYHTPADTADKVDGEGLVKVAAVAREFVAYLAERDRPLTAHLAAGGPPGIAAANSAGGSLGERRASLGTIPDYAFSGPGVRITGTMPGSPAEKAGLIAGDVLTGIGETHVGSMRDFSDALKRHAPGDTVTITFVRGGATMSAPVVLASR